MRIQLRLLWEIFKLKFSALKSEKNERESCGRIFREIFSLKTCYFLIESFYHGCRRSDQKIFKLKVFELKLLTCDSFCRLISLLLSNCFSLILGFFLFSLLWLHTNSRPFWLFLNTVFVLQKSRCYLGRCDRETHSLREFETLNLGLIEVRSAARLYTGFQTATRFYSLLAGRLFASFCILLFRSSWIRLRSCEFEEPMNRAKLVRSCPKLKPAVL